MRRLAKVHAYVRAVHVPHDLPSLASGATQPLQVTRPLPASLAVAAALACGIAAADALPVDSPTAAAVAAWLGLAGVASMGVLAAIPRVDSGRWACLAGASLCAGLSLGASQARHGFPPAGREGVVRLVGRIASAPRETAVGADVLAGHAHGNAGVVFQLSVDSIEDQAPPTVHPRAACADVTVRVQALGELPPRGTRVRVTGWYRPPGRALNPGARAPSGDGSVAVARCDQVEPVSGTHTTLTQRVRLAADSMLDASMPGWATPASRALVKAMTTGVREPALVAPGAEFRMAGMSHILAISGFNIAVLVGVSVGLAAAAGARVPVRASVAVATSVLFLIVTEPEVSVLRAGLGAGIAALAGIRGGRARGLGTLGAVAAITLALDPSSLASAGFQLSYGVVLGLLTLAGAPSERWQARTNALLATVLPARIAAHEGCALGCKWLVGAAVSSTVAFTVSTPIALWHGGFVSTYAAPISVFTMPAAALVTIGGVIAIAVGSASASIATLAGNVACACAWSLAAVAHSAADWPGACWWIGRPAQWWVVLSLVAVAVLWVAPLPVARRCAAAALCVLAALAWTGVGRPHAAWPQQGTLRVELLDVGNGACSLLRSRTHAVLYDAGTSSDDSAGSRRIVPSLAALGVQRLDAIVISHDRLAHFSAVPEVVRAFGVRRVLVSGAMLAPTAGPDGAYALAQGATGALRTLAAWLGERGVPLEPLHAGDEVRAGDIALRALWPRPAMLLDSRADGCVVVRAWVLDARSPDACVVLLGALTARGCDGLLEDARRSPESFTPVAALALPPAATLPESLRRLMRHLEPRATLAHARHADGAQQVDVHPDGTTTVRVWSPSGWRPADQDGPLQTNDIANR